MNRKHLKQSTLVPQTNGEYEGEGQQYNPNQSFMSSGNQLGSLGRENNAQFSYFGGIGGSPQTKVQGQTMLQLRASVHAINKSDAPGLSKKVSPPTLRLKQSPKGKNCSQSNLHGNPSTKTLTFLQKSLAKGPQKGSPIVHNMFFPTQQAQQTAKSSKKKQQLLTSAQGPQTLRGVNKEQILLASQHHSDSLDSINSTTSMTGLRLEPRPQPKKHNCANHNAAPNHRHHRQHTESLSGGGSSTQRGDQDAVGEQLQKYKPRTSNKGLHGNPPAESLTISLNQVGKINKQSNIIAQSTRLSKEVRDTADMIDKHMSSVRMSQPTNLHTQPMTASAQQNPRTSYGQPQQFSNTGTNFNNMSPRAEPEYQRQKSFQTSDYKLFKSHDEQIKRVQASWEGNCNENQFWDDHNNGTRLSGSREIMSSISVKSQTQSVLDKQKEIFKNLRSKNKSSQLKSRINYQDGDEVLSCEDQPTTFRDSQNPNILPNASMMPFASSSTTAGEPEKPKFPSSKASHRLVKPSQIHEFASEDEAECAQESNLNVTSYEDWLKSQQNKQAKPSSDNMFSDMEQCNSSDLNNITTKAYSAITQPVNLHKSQQPKLPPHTAQAPRQSFAQDGSGQQDISGSVDLNQMPLDAGNFNNLIGSPLSQQNQPNTLQHAGSPLRPQKTLQIKKVVRMTSPTQNDASKSYLSSKHGTMEQPPQTAPPVPQIQVQLPQILSMQHRQSFLAGSIAKQQQDEAVLSENLDVPIEKGHYPHQLLRSQDQKANVKNMLLSPRKRILIGRKQQLNDHLSSAAPHKQPKQEIKKQLTGGQLRARKINGSVVKSKEGSPPATRQQTQQQTLRAELYSQAVQDYEQPSALQNQVRGNLITAPSQLQKQNQQRLNSITTLEAMKPLPVQDLVTGQTQEYTESNSGRRQPDLSRLHNIDTVSFNMKRANKRPGEQSNSPRQPSSILSPESKKNKAKRYGSQRQAEKKLMLSSKMMHKDLIKNSTSSGSSSVVEQAEELEGTTNKKIRFQRHKQQTELKLDDESLADASKAMAFQDQLFQSPPQTNRPSLPFEPKESYEVLEPHPNAQPYDDYEYELNNQIEIQQAGKAAFFEQPPMPAESEVICCPSRQVQVQKADQAPTMPQPARLENHDDILPLPITSPICTVHAHGNQAQGHERQLAKKTLKRMNAFGEVESSEDQCVETPERLQTPCLLEQRHSDLTLQTEKNPQTHPLSMVASSQASNTEGEQLRQNVQESQETSAQRQHSVSCGADFEEVEEPNLYFNKPALKPNMCDAQIQTSQIHFTHVQSTDAYQSQAIDKAYSTDWHLSTLYDDLHFKKEGTSRKQLFADQTEDCGNQVDERQITQETQVQILSQIECEYNAETLKRKKSKDQAHRERTAELYRLGLNTLQALMYVMRLQREWETQTRSQYEVQGDQASQLDLSGQQQIDAEQCIKLLTRCSKMYEAKQMILRLLKMTIDRDRLVKDIRRNKCTHETQLRDKLAQVKRMNQRVESQISALQEEHRIFKRPFIMGGKEYLTNVKQELHDLENSFKQGHYIDERGTTGHKY